ncbi:MAG: Ig-like domain-containing protein [Ignavibacteria bacterium]|nr:Ig-like domain-containing protein [Ignavibacteria bacterium]
MKINLITIITLSFLFVSCANQLPPDGGPVDRNPPTVIRTYPESGTTNFDKQYVEFEFNEYINKTNVSNSIFISPYLEDEPELKWSGKKLRILFPQKLKENKTYVVTLGTDITDLRGNKLSESVTLRFSTGNKIDDGVISGKVFDEKPDGVMIFFYLIDSLGQVIKYDSIRPDFVCQTSRDGSFYLTGLPKGIFRIIAVRDQMKNLLFDINEDEIGFPFRDYELNDTVKSIDGVFFELTKIDTIRPVVNSVKVDDLNHLRINFNEPIDNKSISFERIEIRDTLNRSYKIFGFYSVDKNSLILVTEQLQNRTDHKIEISGARDLSGNEMEKSTHKFYVEADKDTLPINLINLTCNFSTNVMEYFNPLCSLYFNDFVRYDDFKSSIIVEDTTGKSVNFNVSRFDSSSFILSFSELRQKDKIILKVDLRQLEDLAGNRIDSTVKRTIETNSESDYGSVSGQIRNKNLAGRVLLELKNVNQKNVYKLAVESEKYQIKNVLPGSYLMKLSIPINKETKLDKYFAQPFAYYKDTIKVKSRWPTTDVNFNLNELFR